MTPETSYGFDVIDFARDVMYHPLDPWQEFAVIHGGELLPNGLPRFRHVLIIVARQNGKSEIPIVLGLFWMFVDEVPLILWTSTQLKYAGEAIKKAEKYARRSPILRELVPVADHRKWAKMDSGALRIDTDESSFRSAAANEEGGRSLTVHRLIQDELRQHKDFKAWGAAVPAMSAVPDAQAWHLSNAGEDHSIVLNDKRAAALAAILAGDTETDTCLMEWSCEEDADPLDLEALAQANPGMGYHGPSSRTLLGDARSAVAAGGEAMAKFRTENMCIRVRLMNPAIDPDHWRRGAEEGDLSGARSRIAACLDLSPDLSHASLYGAAVMPDGRVRVQVLGAWYGADCTKNLRRDLPGLIGKIKPRVLGWFPNGPAASVAADLRLVKAKGAVGRTELERALGRLPEPITTDVTAVCMGLAEQVTSGQILHDPDDALLDDHVGSAEKLYVGDAWRFSRKGEGSVDAAYAAAGAVHLARTIPAAVGKVRFILPSSMTE